MAAESRENQVATNRPLCTALFTNIRTHFKLKARARARLTFKRVTGTGLGAVRAALEPLHLHAPRPAHPPPGRHAPGPIPTPSSFFFQLMVHKAASACLDPRP
eukprot:2115318-Rhodomonas_salina.1